VSPHVWVPSTYFAEGYPYAIVNNLAEVLFQQAGAGLGLIGLTSLFHAPWNLKFLWATWVDSIASKRSWMISAQLACALFVFALAALPVSEGSLFWFSALFLALAISSATNDIAIDAYYMEALADGEQAKFVGYRATAYKLATLLVKGPLITVLGAVGFGFGFFAMGCVLLIVALAHIWILPEPIVRGPSLLVALRSAPSRSRRIAVGFALAAVGLVLFRDRLPLVVRFLTAGSLPLSFWVGVTLLLVLGAVWAWISFGKQDQNARPALAALMATPKIGVALAFIVFFRTGESFLQKMKWPFLQTLGVSMEQYGLVNGTLGALAGFAGTFIGGFLIARGGLGRWFWWFILAQNMPNLAYVGLAAIAPAGTAAAALGGYHPLVVGVVCVEELGSGFGTAVLMVYLMRLCDKEHRATHFAVLTAIMSLSFTFAGAASGFIAEALGYARYFAFTFAATLPMMLLGAVAPGRDARPKEG